MSKRPKDKGLTEQQELFCREYLVDLNGSQAAMRAGYSEKTACEQASRLLTNVKVSERLRILMDKKLSRTDLNADTVLQELLKIALVDVAEAYDDSGNLLPIKEMPKAIRQAISSIEDGEIRKLRFYDKTKALELLGKHLKLFTELREISGKVTLEDLVSQSAGDKKEI